MFVYMDQDIGITLTAKWLVFKMLSYTVLNTYIFYFYSRIYYVIFMEKVFNYIEVLF